MNVVAPSPWPSDNVPELVPGAVRVWSAGAGDVRDALRHILAAYTGADPATLAIEPAACVHCGEPHGKPFLADQGAGWLRFNLSHSDEMAVIAVAHGREVGVDVEVMREGRRLQGIADRRFTGAEAASLRELEGDHQRTAFYRLWARKEAYLKATAEGLAGRLDSFDALDPGAREREGWEFADLDVGDGYAGALALAPPGFAPATAPAGAARRSP